MVPNMGPVENGHKKKADGTAKPAMLPLTLAPLGQIPHLKSREKNASPSFLLPLSCFPFFLGGNEFNSVHFIKRSAPETNLFLFEASCNCRTLGLRQFFLCGLAGHAGHRIKSWELTSMNNCLVSVCLNGI